MILHEDRDLLVVDKPAGLLTMGTDSAKTRTAIFLTDYVRKGYSNLAIGFSRDRLAAQPAKNFLPAVRNEPDMIRNIA